MVKVVGYPHRNIKPSRYVKMKSKCPRCGKRKHLTKHSLSGNHKYPFIRICRVCHDRIHKCSPMNKKEKIARGRK